MTKHIYPNYKTKRYDPHLDRRWRLDCDLAYDGGRSRWSKGYRTRPGARIAAWFHYHLASYGGTIDLIDQEAS
jgi:hypothetical protein